MFISTSLITILILLVNNELALSLKPRIANGSNASKGEFPYQVSFQKKSMINKHFCAGAIIGKQFVLTAAHCVAAYSQNPSDVIIVSGVTDLKTPITSTNLHKINKVFLHPSYHRPLPKENDIALVKVDRPFVYDRYTNQIALASSTYKISATEKVTAAGWGLEKATDILPPDTLKKVTLRTIDFQKCTDKYKGILKLENTIFCTTHFNSFFHRGVCNGDSGGPIVVNKNTLVGIVKGSFQGSPVHNIRPVCGSKTYPDMHSDVSHYRDWIDRTMAANA